MYDVIVIGSGPAGMSAGRHAQECKLKALVISKTPAPNGVVLEFVQDEVISLDKNIVSFAVETKTGRQYYSRSVIIATGCDGPEGNSYFERITLKDALGKIFVDANMQTNIPGIFAAGDITVTLAKGTASAVLEGGRAALTVDKILKKVYS